MNRRMRLGIPALLLAALLPGCQLGPGRLKVSSAHYSDAVRVAASEQLLTNLVRLRYRDLPVFLGVTSISTQFQLDAALDASGTVNTLGAPDSVGLGAGIGYSERPTISFAIRGGEAFQRRMLRRLPVEALAFFAESGWRADRVLRLVVQEMNGLANAPTASGPTPSRAPEYRAFDEAASLLQALIVDGLVRFEFEERSTALSDPLPVERVDGVALIDAIEAGAELRASADGRGFELVAPRRTPVLRFAPRAAGSDAAARLRELLRLAPDAARFPIVAAAASAFDPFAPGEGLREIAVDTRSLLGTLFYVSQGVEPPEADLETGRATRTFDETGAPFAWSTLLGGVFRAPASEGAPEGAAVAVRHRGHWFHIADDDETSKSTFLLLEQLFTLTAGDVEGEAPVLTLPVGG